MVVVVRRKGPVADPGEQQGKTDDRDGQTEDDGRGVGRRGTDLAQGDRQEEPADRADEDKFPIMGRRPPALAKRRLFRL